MTDASEPARVYLREKWTGLFYSGPGQWTECVDEALGFRHGEEALCCACEQNLHDVELFLVFPGAKGDVRIPLHRFF